jgi:hypothetical protein
MGAYRVRVTIDGHDEDVVVSVDAPDDAVERIQADRDKRRRRTYRTAYGGTLHVEWRNVAVLTVGPVEETRP